MRGLTIHQPFANFIADGKKQYETRSWRPSYIGQVAIHAGKYQEPAGYYGWEIEGPFGAIIAVGWLIFCHRAEDIRDSLPQNELAVGDYRDGRYALELVEVVKLAQPVPLRGYQGLWNVPPDVAAAIEAVA